jgi:lysozyme family protein
MSLNQAAIQDAILALQQITRREDATTDPAEIAVITREKHVLIGAISSLATADLLEAAQTVNALIDSIEACIAAAQRGPFHGGFLAGLSNTLDDLNRTLSQMQGSEALPPAPDDSGAALSAAKAKAMQPTSAPGLPSKKTDFASLKAEYTAWFAACEVRPDKKDNLEFYITKIVKGRSSYEKVATATSVPWFFIAITHGMEGGFNFTTHLHNGDPLSARTVNVPAGRPQFGTPPFAWHDSAIDAIRFDGLHEETDWSLPRMLFRFEKFNGMGYRKLGVPTPYLWSHSQLYTKGKFTSDGKFNPEAVSKQTGAAVQLKELVNRGIAKVA